MIMKVLLLGNGISNQGAAKLLNSYDIEYDVFNTEDVVNYNYQLVVKSPGIKNNNEVVRKFKELKIPVINDVELAYSIKQAFFIGVTGSNGKTTTVMLINHILKQKYRTTTCGNIGYSVCDAYINKLNYEMFVCELSSFQLENIRYFAPKISVMLNINPCHMDFHGSYQNYIDAKARITMNQTEEDFLVYHFDDANLKKIADKSQAHKISFSTTTLISDCYLIKNDIYYKGKKILNYKKFKIEGEHNILDVMAAICVCKILNIKNSMIKKGLQNFVPAKYRLEKLANNIYNDAKSTNPFSTIEAIKTISKPVSLICGGYDRGESLEPLSKVIPYVKHVYAYGQTANKIQEFFLSQKVAVDRFETLFEASSQCLSNNDKNVILYSPMFASYDQYDSYAKRGEEFNRIIKKDLRPRP